MLDFIKKCLVWVSVISVVISLNGCATANSMMGGNARKDAVAEITWSFAKDAVLIELDADQKLNLHDNQAHTLLLGIYQMTDSAVFHKLLNDPVSFAKTLETGKAGEGFVMFSRYVVAPGKHIILSFDRAQNAKFIGIAAGYYHLDPTHAARLFEIPVNVTNEGMLAKTYTAVPVPLGIRLTLGAETIVNAQRLNHYPSEKRQHDAVPLDGGGKEIKLTAEELKNAADIGNAIHKLQK